MRRLYWAQAILFVGAYLCFLGYFAFRDSGDSSATLPRSAAPLLKPEKTVRNAAEKSEAGAVSNSVNSANSKVLTPNAAALTSASTPASEEETAHQQERERLSQVSLQATSASEPQARAEAIDRLDVVAAPEVLQALQIVATSDAVVRNRIRAVNSLRRLAGRGDSNEGILGILRLAMSDSDPGVASRAATAYRELTEPSTEENAVAE